MDYIRFQIIMVNIEGIAELNYQELSHVCEEFLQLCINFDTEINEILWLLHNLLSEHIAFH